MQSAIFYLLISYGFFQICSSKFVYEMKLIKYTNPTNKTYLNDACGSLNQTQNICHTGFLFCLVDLPFRNPQDCSLGDYATPVIGTENLLNFNNGSANFTYRFQIEKMPSKGIGMMVEVRDYWTNSTWAPIDFYTTELSFTTDRTVQKRFSSLFNHNTSLLIESRVHCAQNYFGNNCETFCKNELNNNYECDSKTGAYICKNGFVGEFCQIPNICTTQPCLNSGICKSIDGINYKCKCQAGYEGYDCEKRGYSYMTPCFSEPCFNGGECSEISGGFQCQCKSGFYGQHCEADLRSTKMGLKITQRKMYNKGNPFSSLVAFPTSSKPAKLTAKKVLAKFKSLNDPKKILKFSENLTTRNTETITTTKITTIETEDIKFYSSAEVEMLQEQTFELKPEMKKKTYNKDIKRPCIDFNPCKHGKCDMNNKTMEFSCLCETGYMGPFCDIMKHPCDFKPCENGICERDGDMYYKCLCQEGFTGVNCQTKIEPCIESKCLNSGRCKSNNQTGCECPINFTGTYCEQEINHVAFKNSVTIRCDPNPCQNNGICFENILDNKKTIECLCPVSYSGKFCEKAGVTCEKCQNGGLCKVINSTTVTCECPRGLTGENCESDIDECQAKDACENKSACINTFGSFQCVCLPGYYGIKCEKNDNDVFIHQGTKSTLTKKLDPCTLKDCQNNSTCILDTERHIYICQCQEGFTGSTCETEMVKEHHICDQNNPCENDSTCTKENNGYKCNCKPFFTGINCETEIDPCENDPCKHGSCLKESTGVFKCDCFLGFEGLLCDRDINPCKKGNVCHNKGICVYDTASENNFQCKCQPGFNGKTCQIDIDECLSSPCLNGGQCSQSQIPNDYTCNCPGKFIGKNCQIERRMEKKNNACELYGCLNNASCKIDNHRPQCICSPEFFGEKCQKKVMTDCIDNICLNDGQCLFNEQNKTIKCNCKKGYTGHTCNERNICDIKTQNIPCYNNGTCLTSNNTEHCECKDGFSGQNCEISIKLNGSNKLIDSIVNNSSIDTDYGTAELSTLNVEVIESFPVNSPRDLIKSSTNSQNRSLEIAANIVGIDSKKKLISKSEAELSETEKPETKISTATLSILLGTIYGLAFIFAVVWVVWFMLRKKPEPDNLKRQRDIENRLSQDTLSICSNI